MSIKIYKNVVQGSDEWLELRRGLITASEMKLIITPTFKIANNDKEKAHLYELAAQRITGYVEPSYISDDMLRGYEDEIEARQLYSECYHPVQEIGFITSDRFGFTIGYSPDGVVGDNGLIECKGRRQKHQLKTLIECVEASIIPDEYIIQCQTGLLVSEREWLDFITYCGGMEMAIIRVYPDKKIQDAIIEAATVFEAKIIKTIEKYETIKKSGARMIPTERRIELEISL